MKNKGRVAEWSAQPTDKRRDSSSIPAEVKTFFGEIKRLERYISRRFELNLNFKLNLNFELNMNFELN